MAAPRRVIELAFSEQELAEPGFSLCEQGGKQRPQVQIDD